MSKCSHQGITWFFKLFTFRTVIDALDAGANLQHCYANGITPFLNERDRCGRLHFCWSVKWWFSALQIALKRLKHAKHTFRNTSNFHAKYIPKEIQNTTQTPFHFSKSPIANWYFQLLRLHLVPWWTIRSVECRSSWLNFEGKQFVAWCNLILISVPCFFLHNFWKFFSQLIIITNPRYDTARLTPKRPTGGCFAWATGCRPGKLNGKWWCRATGSLSYKTVRYSV